MAALLVSLAVMSVLMSAALPAWRHQAQREKEAELVFRGEQYVRAIPPLGNENGPRNAAADVRHARPAEIPPEEIQGPDDRGRRVPAALAGVNLPAPVVRGQGRGGRRRAARAHSREPPDASAGRGAAASRHRWEAAGSSASPARARNRRSASTKAARTTTSGTSCSRTSPRGRRPRRADARRPGACPGQPGRRIRSRHGAGGPVSGRQGPGKTPAFPPLGPADRVHARG